MILDWLNRPYPFVSDTSVKWALSMVIGLICFLFLVVFRPFGLDDVKSVTYLAGFGLTAFISLLVHFILLPGLFPSLFDEARWNIRKQLGFISSIILVIAVLNFIYNVTIGREISPQYDLPFFVVLTALVGVLPIICMTYIIERVENNRNRVVAESLMLPKPTRNDPVMITIESENQTEDQIELPIDSFLYAGSSNNYLDLFFLEHDQLKRKVIRLSLKGLLSQLEKYPQVRRVHKSYIVNISNIVSVEGNARSLYVLLRNTEQQIPVSRSVAKETLT